MTLAHVEVVRSINSAVEEINNRQNLKRDESPVAKKTTGRDVRYA